MNEELKARIISLLIGSFSPTENFFVLHDSIARLLDAWKTDTHAGD